MSSINNPDHFFTLPFIFHSLVPSSPLSQSYDSQMDGHSVGNRQGLFYSLRHEAVVQLAGREV